jgi:hypothetical protein
MQTMPSQRHDTGPHLVTAALCETVLQEPSGVLSLIRMVDQITQSATGPDAPEQMPPFMLSTLTLVVSLKADQARGRHGIKIRPEQPGGQQLPEIEQPVQLMSGGGVNLVMPLLLPITLEGTYWFDIIFTGPPPQADRLLTRVPLQVLYSPQRIGGPPADA